jgi:Potassium-transporting ATPase A subunit
MRCPALLTGKVLADKAKKQGTRAGLLTRLNIFSAGLRQPEVATTRVFAVLVFGTIVVGGALCFFPALALGPIVESG